MPRGIKLLLVVIVGVDKDRCLKCDVDTLTIIQHFLSDHVPNGPSIPPQSVSFRFGWMNCNPFDAAFVGGSQGHCLSIELYYLHHNRIALLCLCRKRLVLWNGGVILNETLLNCSIATFHFLPLIRHFTFSLKWIKWPPCSIISVVVPCCQVVLLFCNFLDQFFVMSQKCSTLVQKAANSLLFIGTV
jgi:hypothetical protein